MKNDYLPMKPSREGWRKNTLVIHDCSDGFGGYEIGAFSNYLNCEKKSNVWIRQSMKSYFPMKLICRELVEERIKSDRSVGTVRIIEKFEEQYLYINDYMVMSE